MRNPYFVFVISPTEYGGQIEHAYDTAAALAQEQTVQRVVLLTRPGADAYLFHPDRPKLEIRELLPPRRFKGGRLWNAVRPLFQSIDLLIEHVVIRRQVAETGSSSVLLVLDTSRYPAPRILSPIKRKAKIAMFVHNARPHVPDENRTLRDHVLLFLERQCINGADLAVTHGEQQLRTVAAYTTTKLASVPLPEASFLDSIAPAIQDVDEQFTRPYALCIGELRENKGIEVAMNAAKAAGVALLVAGKSDNEEMALNLLDLAEQHDGTVLVDEFLAKSRFDFLIQDANVILLPYTHFDAQSGILAKAMRANKTIIASDLPALREQAEGYTNITFVPPGKTSDLANKLRVDMNAIHTTTVAERCADPEHEWKAIAQTLLTNV